MFETSRSLLFSLLALLIVFASYSLPWRGTCSAANRISSPFFIYRFMQLKHLRFSAVPSGPHGCTCILPIKVTASFRAALNSSSTTRRLNRLTVSAKSHDPSLLPTTLVTNFFSSNFILLKLIFNFLKLIIKQQ